MMNSSPENFDQLRKLLAIKRYEQPPPGYFNHFSDRIIARIEAGDQAIGATSWWHRWVLCLDARPVLACAYGLAISGLLAAAVGVSQSLESDQTDAAATPSWFGASSPTLGVLPLATRPTVQPWAAQAYPTSSINPVLSSSAPSFLFDANRLQIEPASYNPGVRSVRP